MDYYYTRIFEGRAEEILYRLFGDVHRALRALPTAPSALGATRAPRVAWELCLQAPDARPSIALWWQAVLHRGFLDGLLYVVFWEPCGFLFNVLIGQKVSFKRFPDCWHGKSRRTNYCGGFQSKKRQIPFLCHQKTFVFLFLKRKKTVSIWLCLTKVLNCIRKGF